MGILGNIFSKIFPSSHPAVTAATGAAAGAAAAATAASASAEVAAAEAAAATPATPIAPVNAAISEVDVEAIMDEKADNAGQKLNWRTSIVDLLKLLDLDSSLQARKELAHELDFSGDTNDSASMNIWLHKQVMNKLAANGGKVPADLQD